MVNGIVVSPLFGNVVPVVIHDEILEGFITVIDVIFCFDICMTEITYRFDAIVPKEFLNIMFVYFWSNNNKRHPGRHVFW